MITLFYAGLCTLLVVFLAMRVVHWRFTRKIGIGHGEDRQLERRIRVHANAVENLPLALILLGGMELNGYDDRIIHTFGATLLASRVAHAWGLSHHSGTSRGRRQSPLCPVRGEQSCRRPLSDRPDDFRHALRPRRALDSPPRHRLVYRLNLD